MESFQNKEFVEISPIEIKQFYEAIYSNNISLVIKYLNEIKTLINIRDIFGNNALQLAISKNYYMLANKLIEYGVDINNRNKNGFTALSLAIKCNYENCVKLLLDNNAKMFPNIDNIYPIHIALKYNRDVLFSKYLLPTIKREFINANIMLCCTDNLGQTPLHYGVMYNSMETIKILINENIPIDQEDNFGNSALLLAAKYRNNKALIYLIKSGANIISINNLHQNIFHLAIKTNNIEIIEFIVNRYEYVFLRYLIQSKDLLGFSPLSYTLSSWRAISENKSNDASNYLLKYYLSKEYNNQLVHLNNIYDPSLIVDIRYCICPICRKLYYKPISLSCGHTYCRSCVFSLLFNNNTTLNYKKCPICQKDIIIMIMKYDVYIDDKIKEWNIKLWSIRDEEMRNNPYENIIKNIETLGKKIEKENLFFNFQGICTLQIIDLCDIIIRFCPITKELLIFCLITPNISTEQIELDIMQYLLNYQFDSLNEINGINDNLLYSNKRILYHIYLDMCEKDIPMDRLEKTIYIFIDLIKKMKIKINEICNENNLNNAYKKRKINYSELEYAKKKIKMISGKVEITNPVFNKKEIEFEINGISKKIMILYNTSKYVAFINTHIRFLIENTKHKKLLDFYRSLHEFQINDWLKRKTSIYQQNICDHIYNYGFAIKDSHIYIYVSSLFTKNTRELLENNDIIFIEHIKKLINHHYNYLLTELVSILCKL